MANYLSDRTGASIDTVLDNADTGGIGKGSTSVVEITDFDALTINQIGASGTSTLNSPSGSTRFGVINLQTISPTQSATIAIDGITNGKAYFKNQTSGWQELYHTGNTSVATFGSTQNGSAEGISIGDTAERGVIDVSRAIATISNAVRFWNPDGLAGSITITGTATAYNTSSDPRLKDFAEAPADSAINAEFNSLYSCFRTFNWKNDPQGDLVWGFDAHACIDAGTGIGSEGEGSRGLNLGDTYETIPAVTENRVVNDAEGNPTSEIETVVITAAIEKKVSPAGVDQSKAVPILLAKIEQLERRLTLAGL